MEELFLNSRNLPEPLSKEEIFKLFEKYKNNQDRLCFEKLVEHNIRLVIYEVQHRFKFVDYDKKELVATGNVGLLKAIETYDVSKNVDFPNYAIRCIDNEILMFLRKIKNKKNIVSFDEVLYTDQCGNELRLGDTLFSDIDIEANYQCEVVNKAICEVVNNLVDKDKKVVVLFFGFFDDKVYTKTEIASMLSVSPSYVSRLLSKVVNRISLELQQEGIIEPIMGNILKKVRK